MSKSKAGPLPWQDFEKEVPNNSKLLGPPHRGRVPALPAKVVTDAEREGYVAKDDQKVGLTTWIVLVLTAFAFYAYCS